MGRRRRRQKIKFQIPYLDPGRHSSPYVEGSRWWIQQHDPPPPFGEGYKTLHRRGPAVLQQMRAEQLPQSIYCLTNQPPGPEPREDAPRVEIEVRDALRDRIAHGAQVLACRVVSGRVGGGGGQTNPDVVVAKIFDPMYFYHNGEFDIVELADMEYCREAAAYKRLQRAGVDGELLPKYYGSYTVDVPLTEEQKGYLAQHAGADHALLQQADPVRRVRLVLIEQVEGQAMTVQLVFGDAASLPDATRMGVLAATLEAYAQLYFYGVAHGDLAPRNVFLQDEEGDGGDNGGRGELAKKRPRFHRFVDLGLAYVLGEPGSAFPGQQAGATRPLNPIRLFWHVFESGIINMYYWLPPDLRNTEAFHRWMLQRWYGDARFEPLGAVPGPLKDDQAWDTDTGKTVPDNGGQAGVCRASSSFQAKAEMPGTGAVAGEQPAARGGWHETDHRAADDHHLDRPQGFW